MIRTFEAHSGEISDTAVLNDGTSLVTTGWSRQLNGSLRIDRLVYVSPHIPLKNLNLQVLGITLTSNLLVLTAIRLTVRTT